MTTFRIKYFDPDEEQFKTTEMEFKDSENPKISAREWAEDWAYSAADKRCDYTITEIRT